MSQEEANKALMRRWYDEMWANLDFALIPELAGPTYTRHEMGGTRVVTAEEYRDQTKGVMAAVDIADMRYALIAEGDKVCALGSWTFAGAHWDWVQLFRAERGRLVETWLSGIGMDSHWGPDAYASVDVEPRGRME